MNAKIRTALFTAGALGFAAVYAAGLGGLPRFGNYRGPYGDAAGAAGLRHHATDAVSAVNFDIRGFDTLGEEFILFTSVMGVSLLLRKLKDDQKTAQPDKEPGRIISPPSEATRAFSLVLVGLLVLLGIYIVVHGHLTPGGGFQGGVILATAPLLVYLAGDYEHFRKVASHALVEVGEAVGAGGYVLIGLGGLLGGAAFLENILPLGQLKSVFSGGTIAVIDLSVGLEVAAGFVLLLLAFLEETLDRKTKGTL